MAPTGKTFLGLAASLLLFAGCPDEFGARQAINGRVTLKGQPVKEGVIEFVPIGETATAADVTKSGAVVRNGNYTMDVENGLFPGMYLVRITAGDGMTPANPDEPPGPSRNIVSKELIPPAYNVDSTQEVEVKLNQPNKFDFLIP